MRRGGKVIGAVVTFVDISERRRVQEELCTLNAALENAVEGIARLDTRGHYVSVNRAYAEMLGHRPEEMLGMEWQQTVHPKDLAAMSAAYHRMQAEGRAECEVMGVRKDGSVFWKQTVMVQARDERGRRTGHYCFMKDVTGRKRAEAACGDTRPVRRSSPNGSSRSRRRTGATLPGSSMTRSARPSPRSAST